MIGLFVCMVVLVVADVYDGGSRRNARELLRGASSALGPLLLVGVVAGLAITVLASIVSTILFVLIAGVALSAGVGLAGLILGLLLLPVLVVPELFLLTIWSVLAAVTVLERPGRLRALGRSRQLVSGNAWRVLALILMLAIPLALAAAEIERAARTAGNTPATAAIQVLIATLIAPIPALATTTLYFELHHADH